MRDDMYTSFAEVYDSFMSDVPYGRWAEFICGLLRENGIADGLALELCCGTGTFTGLMAAAGYDMIGVDSSQEMLDLAAKKRAASGADILYLQQDMREFELYGTVRAIVCVCDSMNYITDGEDLKKVFALAHNYLDPQGMFVFDMKTVYCLREVMGDTVTAEHRPEGSLIWENNYFEEEQMNEYDLTFFVRQGDGLYRKYQETHLQRAYETDTVARLLAEAGFQLEAVRDADTFGEARADSERLYYISRRA